MRALIMVTLLFLAGCSEQEHSVMESGKSDTKSAGSNVSTAPISSKKSIPESKRTKVSSDAATAFVGLYGGSVWKDESLAEYFGNQSSGYITPVYEEHFKESGVEKMLVLGYITPEPLEEYSCHACIPLLGGAIFAKHDAAWKAESVQKIIGWGDPFESGRFNIVQTGKDKYGVSLRIADAHQGYFDLTLKLLVPINGKLDVALDIGFGEKPGGIMCPDDENDGSDLLPQDIEIKFEQGLNQDYFDVIAHMQYNDGECGHFEHYDQTTRYVFQNGKYKPI